MVGFGGISSMEGAGRVSRDGGISGISLISGTGGTVPIIYIFTLSIVKLLTIDKSSIGQQYFMDGISGNCVVDGVCVVDGILS